MELVRAFAGTLSIASGGVQFCLYIYIYICVFCLLSDRVFSASVENHGQTRSNCSIARGSSLWLLFETVSLDLFLAH